MFLSRYFTCAQVLQQYRSVADYVQVTKLDFDTVTDEGDIPLQCSIDTTAARCLHWLLADGNVVISVQMG